MQKGLLVHFPELSKEMEKTAKPTDFNKWMQSRVAHAGAIKNTAVWCIELPHALHCVHCILSPGWIVSGAVVPIVPFRFEHAFAVRARVLRAFQASRVSVR
jgi:hypothetical protein